MSVNTRRSAVVGLVSACGLATAAMGALPMTWCAYPGQSVGSYLPGGTDEILTLFGAESPWIANDGSVLFRWRVNGSVVDFDNDTALWIWRPTAPSALSLVVRESQAVPGLAGAFFGQVRTDYRLMPNGSVYTGGGITGPATIADDNDAIYSLWSPSNAHTLAARRGSIAGNNLPPGVLYDFSGPFSAQDGCVIDNGTMFFLSGLRGGDVGPTNDQAWMYGTPTGLRSILRKGDTLGAGTISGTGFNRQLNASGQALFDTQYAEGGSITTDNDAALWLFTPGSPDTYTQVAREGSSYASIAGGATLAPFSPNPAPECLNNAGQVLFDAFLVEGTGSPAAVAGVSDQVKVRWTPGPGGAGPGTYEQVLRTGDAAPFIPGATITVMGVVQMAMNDTGGMVISAVVTGPGITQDVNDHVLYYCPSPGVFRKIWRTGDPAPGITGALLAGFINSQFYAVNNRGQVVFTSDLAQDPNGPPDAVTPFVNSGTLYAWSESTGLRLLARQGDPVTAPNSVTYNFGFFGYAYQNGGGSRSGSFTNDGRFTAINYFADGSTGIGTWTIPACVADTDDGTNSGTPDGGVGIEDLLFYLAAFEAGTSNADVDDGSGTGTQDGGVGIEDLLYFLTRFEAGC